MSQLLPYAGSPTSLSRDAQSEPPQPVDPFAQSGSENLFSGLSMSATDLEAAGELLSFPPVAITDSGMEPASRLRSPTDGAGFMPSMAARPGSGAARLDASDAAEPSPRNGESHSVAYVYKCAPISSIWYQKSSFLLSQLKRQCYVCRVHPGRALTST